MGLFVFLAHVPASPLPEIHNRVVLFAWLSYMRLKFKVSVGSLKVSRSDWL